ncbi:hypothetical protein [Ruminococcus albus]|uniref:hypothetical protein n=1 Tax=Ruminococcus albus TaxID=1264 RepID=UPI001D146522|nr:hypothetical protein [Ruminococcus albus]MCC3350225.1 hypothetical protein [Ruminococcus albus 8]
MGEQSDRPQAAVNNGVAVNTAGASPRPTRRECRPKSGQFARNQRGAQTSDKRSPFVARRIARVHQPNSDSVFGGRGAVPRDKTANPRGGRS